MCKEGVWLESGKHLEGLSLVSGGCLGGFWKLLRGGCKVSRKCPGDVGWVF